MAQTVVLQLVGCNTLTDAQFYSLRDHPLLGKFDISTTFLRFDLLRTLEREGATPQVIERCIQEGDGSVHRRLLEIGELPRDVVETLSINGATKAVRNIAKECLGSRRYKNQPAC